MHLISNIHVERTGKNSVEVIWEIKDKNPNVLIYHGNSANAIDRTSPVARVTGETRARITELSPDLCHYFEVAAENCPGIITSERRIPLEGTVNFRDLGGYQTLDGRSVKWGLVFRSDSLASLTNRDQAFLRQMGIKLVCDFRTLAEANKAPGRFPGDGPEKYLNLPIVYGEFDSLTAFERMKKGDISWLTKEFVIKGYIKSIDTCADKWEQVFNHLAKKENRPIVLHCTAGKDRSGICAALILLALGVPEETVINDHGLSNVFLAEVLEQFYERIRSFGIDTEKAAPYFTAPQYCIVSVINHIRNTYGSIVKYLNTRCGITNETLDLLNQELLE